MQETGKAHFEHNNRPDVVHGHTTEISEPMAKLLDACWTSDSCER